MINFIIQKLKSKRLFCLSFLWWQVFWGNERKYSTHIPGPSDMTRVIFKDSLWVIWLELCLKTLAWGWEQLKKPVLNWVKHKIKIQKMFMSIDYKNGLNFAGTQKRSEQKILTHHIKISWTDCEMIPELIICKWQPN